MKANAGILTLEYFTNNSLKCKKNIVEIIPSMYKVFLLTNKLTYYKKTSSYDL